MAFIVSKASQDICYVSWTKGRNGLNKVGESVVIKGGANVVNRKTLQVETGTITKVSPKELEFLKNDASFKRHLDRGWVFIAKTESEAEKIIANGNKDKDGNSKKDGSAQLTKEDFEKAGKEPPITNIADMK